MSLKNTKLYCPKCGKMAVKKDTSWANGVWGCLFKCVNCKKEFYFPKED